MNGYTKSEIAQFVLSVIIFTLFVVGTMGGLHHVAMMFGWFR